MAVIRKIVAVYMDYDNYMKPKEIAKAFKLFHIRKDCFSNKNKGNEHERMQRANKCVDIEQELKLLLNVICAKDSYDWEMNIWKDYGGKPVCVIQIYETVVSSLFDKPQEI